MKPDLTPSQSVKEYLRIHREFMEVFSTFFRTMCTWAMRDESKITALQRVMELAEQVYAADKRVHHHVLDMLMLLKTDMEDDLDECFVGSLIPLLKLLSPEDRRQLFALHPKMEKALLRFNAGEATKENPSP